jgi:hypothetical protein
MSLMRGLFNYYIVSSEMRPHLARPSFGNALFFEPSRPTLPAWPDPRHARTASKLSSGPVASRGPGRCVGSPTTPRETSETMHSCHAPQRWTWHGLGGKIQIFGFLKGTQRGWQMVIFDESLFSSVSRSVLSAFLIFDLWH